MAGIGTYDTEGWTVLIPSNDSKVVYVSSSGSNSNDGLSPETPVQTYSYAHGLVRTGYPDWILFKRGDTFTFGTLEGKLKKAGRSASEPMVIGAYGTGARPVINAQGFYSYSGTNPSPSMVIGYMVIIGIEFVGVGDYLAAETGLTISAPIEDLLVEDCKFSEFTLAINIAVTASSSNIIIRRSVFVDNDVQGFEITGPVDGMLIEENIIDNNGFGIGGYGGEDLLSGANIFKHNVYLRDIVNLVFRKNITSRASYMGLKLAGNAFDSFLNYTVEDNLFYDSATSASASTGTPGITQYRFGNGLYRNNVFTNVGRVFNNGGTSDIAIYNTNAQDVLFDGNIFCHKVHTGGGGGEMFNWGATERCLNNTIRNSIVYNWDTNWPNDTAYFEMFGQVYTESPTVPGCTNLQLVNNQVDQEPETYLDPTRTVGKYYQSIGGADDAEAFLTACHSQSKANWDVLYTASAVNDYIRAGFETSQVSGDVLGMATNGMYLFLGIVS